MTDQTINGLSAGEHDFKLGDIVYYLATHQDWDLATVVEVTQYFKDWKPQTRYRLLVDGSVIEASADDIRHADSAIFSARAAAGARPPWKGGDC